MCFQSTQKRKYVNLSSVKGYFALESITVNESENHDPRQSAKKKLSVSVSGRQLRWRSIGSN